MLLRQLHCFGTGKGNGWNRVRSCGTSSSPGLWHNFLCAHSCASSSSKAAGNAQDFAHLPPAPESHGLSPCSTSRRNRSQVWEQTGPSVPAAPALPQDSPRFSRALGLWGASGFPCSHQCFCRVRPETAAVPGSCKPGTHVLLTCVNRSFSLISSSHYDALLSLEFFCLLKHPAA